MLTSYDSYMGLFTPIDVNLPKINLRYAMINGSSCIEPEGLINWLEGCKTEIDSCMGDKVDKFVDFQHTALLEIQADVAAGKWLPATSLENEPKPAKRWRKPHFPALRPEYTVQNERCLVKLDDLNSRLKICKEEDRGRDYDFDQFIGIEYTSLLKIQIRIAQTESAHLNVPAPGVGEAPSLDL